MSVVIMFRHFFQKEKSKKKNKSFRVVANQSSFFSFWVRVLFRFSLQVCVWLGQWFELATIARSTNHRVRMMQWLTQIESLEKKEWAVNLFQTLLTKKKDGQLKSTFEGS